MPAVLVWVALPGMQAVPRWLCVGVLQVIVAIVVFMLLRYRSPLHFTCAARTDVGVVRSGNEDNYLMLSDRGVFIVADGMGGHAAGEVASEMAVRITSREIGSIRGLAEPQVGERIRSAIRVANDAIFERTISEHDKRGMGTTATVLVLM